MANIKEFDNLPYYYSARTEDINDNNFYGLLDIHENRFYILHRDRFLIKYLQILLLKNHHTFSLVDFKNFNFDDHKNIDNNDCYLWGGSALMIKSLNIDADTYFDTVKLISNKNNLFNKELQQKMFYLMSTLTRVDKIFKELTDCYLSNVCSTIENLKEMKNCFKILLPKDKNIPSFIAEESQQLESFKDSKLNKIQDCWNDILRFFYNTNINTESTLSLKSLFSSKLLDPQFKFEERVSRNFNHQKKKLLELYNILDIGLSDNIK